MESLIGLVTVFSFLASVWAVVSCVQAAFKINNSVFFGLFIPLAMMAFIFASVYFSVLLGNASSDFVGTNLLQFVVGVVWVTVGNLAYVVRRVFCP